MPVLTGQHHTPVWSIRSIPLHSHFLPIFVRSLARITEDAERSCRDVMNIGQMNLLLVFFDITTFSQIISPFFSGSVSRLCRFLDRWYRRIFFFLSHSRMPFCMCHRRCVHGNQFQFLKFLFLLTYIACKYVHCHLSTKAGLTTHSRIYDR